MGKRITIAVLAVILLFAAFLRVGLQREELFYPDSCVYLAMAENIKQGVFSRSIFPEVALHQPLYPLLTAAVSLAGPTVETAGMAVSVLAGLGLVLVLFFTGRRLAGTGAGLTAAMLAACDPALVKYSTELLTESLFLCLFYLVLLLVLRAGEDWRPLLALACGALAAAAFGARFIGLSALPAACCWVVLLRLRRSPGHGGPRFRRAMAAGLLVLLGFTLAASPILLRNRVVRGEWSLTGFADRTRSLEAGADDQQGEGGPAGRMRAWVEQYRGMRADNAVDLTFGGYLAEFWRVFRETVPAVWPLLALAGVVVLGCTRRLAGLFPSVYLVSWLLLPMGITFLAGTASGSDEIARYLATLLPALVLLAACGLAAPVDWAVRRLERRRKGSAESPAHRFALFVRLAAPLAAGLVLALLMNSGPLKVMAAERETQSEGSSWVAGAGEVARFVEEWSAGKGLGKLTLMDRKPFVAYFAGCWWRPMPDVRPRRLLLNCYHWKVNLVVVDSAAVALYQPDLAPMVSGEHIPPGFRLVYHRVWRDQERVVAVYQVLHSNREKPKGMARRDALLHQLPQATAQQHALTGRQLFAEGQIHLAGLHLQRAVALQPDFAEAWYQLGAVYFLKSLYLLPDQRHQGAFHKAIRCYGEAARLSPRLASMARREVATLERNLPPKQLSLVYSSLGLLYRQLQQEREARSAFNRALAIDPHNREARNGLSSLAGAQSVEESGQT